VKKGNKKTTSGDEVTDDVMTEQPVEEYLPPDLSRLSAEQAGTEGREVVEQVEDPYETVRKEILDLNEPGEGKEPERAKEKLAAALSFSSPPIPHSAHNLSAGRKEPLKPTRTEKPYKKPYMGNLKSAARTPAPPTALSHISSEGGEELEQEVPEFDLKKAVIFYEILKRPEYFCK